MEGVQSTVSEVLLPGFQLRLYQLLARDRREEDILWSILCSDPSPLGLEEIK